MKTLLRLLGATLLAAVPSLALAQGPQAGPWYLYWPMDAQVKSPIGGCAAPQFLPPNFGAYPPAFAANPAFANPALANPAFAGRPAMAAFPAAPSANASGYGWSFNRGNFTPPAPMYRPGPAPFAGTPGGVPTMPTMMTPWPQ